MILAFIPLFFSTFAFLVNSYDWSTMAALAVVSFGAWSLGFVRCYFGLGKRNQLPLLVFYLGMLFWFYWPCLAGAFTDEQWHQAAALVRTDNSHALTSLVLINLYGFLVALMNQFRYSPRFVKRLCRILGSKPAPETGRLFLVFAIGVVICLSFYVIMAGGPVRAVELMLASRTEDKPWDREGYAGSSIATIEAIAEGWLVAFIALGFHMALDSSDKVRRRLGYVLFAGMALAYIAIERGTRSILVEVALPPLGIYYARVAHRLTAVRLRRTGFLLAAMIGVILAANAQRQYRRTAVIEDVEVEVTDSDFFKQCAFAVAVIEHEKRFMHDSAALHIISGPIPRALWEGKPRMDGMWVYTEYMWGKDTSRTGGNSNMSIVGEYYMNWGWWGVVEVGVFLGLLIRLMDLVFGAAPPLHMARFAVLGVMAYLFVTFRIISFAFFPPCATTVIVAMAISRLRWFRGTPAARS